MQVIPFLLNIFTRPFSGLIWLFVHVGYYLRLDHYLNISFNFGIHSMSVCMYYMCVKRRLKSNLRHGKLNTIYIQLNELRRTRISERSSHSFHTAETAYTDYSCRTLLCKRDKEVSVYKDVVIFIFQQIDYQGNFIVSLHSRTRSLPPFRLL